MKNELYFVNVFENNLQVNSIELKIITKNLNDDVWKWHKRLNHFNWENMRIDVNLEKFVSKFLSLIIFK